MTRAAWQITQPKPFGADQTAVSGTLSTLSSLNSERVVEDKADGSEAIWSRPTGVRSSTSPKKITRRKSFLIGDDTPDRRGGLRDAGR